MLWRSVCTVHFQWASSNYCGNFGSGQRVTIFLPMATFKETTQLLESRRWLLHVNYYNSIELLLSLCVQCFYSFKFRAAVPPALMSPSMWSLIGCAMILCAGILYGMLSFLKKYDHIFLSTDFFYYSSYFCGNELCV